MEGSMTRSTSVLLGIVFLASCGSRQAQVDRIYEDGVEVVLNHLKPYRIPNEPSEIVLEKEYAIDAENPDLFKAGLSDIRQFGVDSRGYVYLTQYPRKDECLIFKFDGQGRLMKCFGRIGQGPGEIEGSSYFAVNSRDEVVALDARRKKLLYFTSSGALAKEMLFSRTFVGVIIPLETGNFLVPESQDQTTPGDGEVFLSLLDPQFDKIKTFCRLQVPSFPKGEEKVNAYMPNPTGTFTANRIYVGIIGRDYEFLVYDLDGTLLRKIRKDYRPIEVTSSFQKEVLAKAQKGNPIAERAHFPDHKPAFQYCFADEAGRLFVMTSEKDKASGQNVCDIFTASGVFIGRTAVGYYDLLRLFWEGLSLDVVAKNRRIYTLHEKENGYKELVVYRAIWR
jgi:hypothetical protein